jgi:Na+/H+-dicarboxylate symporter
MLLSPLLFTILVILIANQSGLALSDRKVGPVSLGFLALNVIFINLPHLWSAHLPLSWNLRSLIEVLIPSSIVSSLATNSVLQIAFFSVFFSRAVAALGSKGQPVLDIFARSLEVMLSVTSCVVTYIAPFGLFGALTTFISKYGFEALPGALKLAL